MTTDIKANNHIKKFYKLAKVKRTAEGCEVTLDGRSLKTPQRQPLRVPSYPLALAIAAEWQCQGEYLKPHTMPLMQMTSTALDLPATKLRTALIDQVSAFLSSDTVCFRDEKPELHKQQDASLSPVISYLREKYSLEYPVCEGMALPHISHETASRFHAICTALSDIQLVALETAVTSAKSTALGLCLIDGFLPVKTVLKLSRLEEEYQIRLFGKVEGAHDLEETQTLMLLASARVLTQLERLRE